MTKSIKKSIIAIGLASLPYLANALDWQAVLTFTAATTNGIPTTDEVRFGVKSVSQTVMDAPGTPSGINIYQELTNSPAALSVNYVSNSDVPMFRGVIENIGSVPTSLVANVGGMIDNMAIITFSDYSRTVTNGFYTLENGKDLKIGANTRGFIVTERPKITGIAFPNGKIDLEAKFYNDSKIPSLNVYGASALDKPFTNYVGKLNSAGLDKYRGTNNLPSGLIFFNTR